MRFPYTFGLVVSLLIALGSCALPQPTSTPPSISSQTKDTYPAPSLTDPSPSPISPDLSQSTIPPCPAVDRGLTYLSSQFNPDLGLIREAPNVAPNIYWLTNDNALAVYVLSTLGESALANSIRPALQKFSFSTNDQIEAVWGETITIPPHSATSVLIAKVGDNEIWQEFHDRNDKLMDWSQYANLAFLGALNDFNRGEVDLARSIYANTLKMFDQTGFRDKAFSDRYETYKLALALYVGVRLQAENPSSAQMLRTLQSMQASNGGFYTHYFDINKHDGDTNTETTSMSLLALHTSGCIIMDD